MPAHSTHLAISIDRSGQTAGRTSDRRHWQIWTISNRAERAAVAAGAETRPEHVLPGKRRWVPQLIGCGATCELHSIKMLFINLRGNPRTWPQHNAHKNVPLHPWLAMQQQRQRSADTNKIPFNWKCWLNSSSLPKSLVWASPAHLLARCFTAWHPTVVVINNSGQQQQIMFLITVNL